MPVAVELARGALPLAVLLDERLQRADQLVTVLAARVLERAEHAVAVEPQRVIVLERAEPVVEEEPRGFSAGERQQQVKGAEVAVGPPGRRGAVRERGRLERA